MKGKPTHSSNTHSNPPVQSSDMNTFCMSILLFSPLFVGERKREKRETEKEKKKDRERRREELTFGLCSHKRIQML